MISEYNGKIRGINVGYICLNHFLDKYNNSIQKIEYIFYQL